MAKKKKSIELSDKKIEFTIENLHYKVIRFYPSSMDLDVIINDKNEKSGIQKFPFAHLPKSIKKLIKPN